MTHELTQRAIEAWKVIAFAQAPLLEEIARLRTAFRVNMLAYVPGATHAQIDDLLSATPSPATGERPDEGHPHLIGGEFQSDKYPTCPRGKVPLSTKDPMAQDLLWEYAQRRRSVDAEFAADLEIDLTNKGYVHNPTGERDAVLEEAAKLCDVIRDFEWHDDGNEYSHGYGTGYNVAGDAAGRNIRALKQSRPAERT